MHHMISHGPDMGRMVTEMRLMWAAMLAMVVYMVAMPQSPRRAIAWAARRIRYYAITAPADSVRYHFPNSFTRRGFTYRAARRIIRINRMVSAIRDHLEWGGLS